MSEPASPPRVAAPVAAPANAFIARQPILDGSRELFAYELLFRSGPENFFPGIDSDVACTRTIADSLSLFGLDGLVGDHRAFFNFTGRAIVDGLPELLPPDRVVIEVLETARPDAELVAACAALKQAGFSLALDDFVDGPDFAPLVALADIIKVDFLATPPPERWALAERMLRQRKTLLAEKVETAGDVREALAHGYALFQGYFFCRPEMISRREVPASKLGYLRFLQELQRSELDLESIERAIKQEVAVSIKLLRYLNSAAFAWRSEVTSIREALVRLGERPFRRWATVVAVAGLADDRPQELVVTCLVRARFCELIAPHAGLEARQPELFLLGILSSVDALLGRPLDEIVEELALPEAVASALRGAPSALAEIFALALAFERGDWERVEASRARLGIAPERLPEAYDAATRWTQQVFGAGDAKRSSDRA